MPTSSGTSSSGQHGATHSSLTPTADPYTFIEEARPGYTRYQQRSVDTPDVVVRRWEVHGTCDRRGDCLVGATLPDGTYVRSKAHLRTLAKARGSWRLDSELDVPVTPEFHGCCPFTYTELSTV